MSESPTFSRFTISKGRIQAIKGLTGAWLDDEICAPRGGIQKLECTTAVEVLPMCAQVEQPRPVVRGVVGLVHVRVPGDTAIEQESDSAKARGNGIHLNLEVYSIDERIRDEPSKRLLLHSNQSYRL